MMFFKSVKIGTSKEVFVFLVVMTIFTLSLAITIVVAIFSGGFGNADTLIIVNYLDHFLFYLKNHLLILSLHR